MDYRNFVLHQRLGTSVSPAQPPVSQYGFHFMQLVICSVSTVTATLLYCVCITAIGVQHIIDRRTDYVMRKLQLLTLVTLEVKIKRSIFYCALV